MNIGFYGSHNPEFTESLAGAHSIIDGLFDQLFATGFFDGAGEGLFHRFLGHDTDAFAVAEDKVAWFDAHAVNFNREAEIYHLAARPLILRVSSPGEGRKAQL